MSIEFYIYYCVYSSCKSSVIFYFVAEEANTKDQVTCLRLRDCYMADVALRHTLGYQIVEALAVIAHTLP